MLGRAPELIVGIAELSLRVEERAEIVVQRNVVAIDAESLAIGGFRLLEAAEEMIGNTQPVQYLRRLDGGQKRFIGRSRLGIVALKKQVITLRLDPGAQQHDAE